MIQQITGLQLQLIEPNNQNSLRKLAIVNMGELPTLSSPYAARIRQEVISNIQRQGTGSAYHIRIGAVNSLVNGDQLDKASNTRSGVAEGAGINSDILQRGGLVTEKLVTHFMIEQGTFASKGMNHESDSDYDVAHSEAQRFEYSTFLNRIGFPNFVNMTGPLNFSNTVIGQDNLYQKVYDPTETFRVYSRTNSINGFAVGFTDVLEQFNSGKYLWHLMTLQDGDVIKHRHENEFWQPFRQENYGQAGDNPENYSGPK